MATAATHHPIRTAFERLTFGHMEDDPTVIHAAARPVTLLVGRVLLSAIFLAGGFGKLADTAGTIAYMQSKGIPAADVLVYFAAFAELLGGLSLLFGFLTRIGSLALIAFMLPTTLIFHDFWNLVAPEAGMQRVNFMKNLAVIGGLAVVFGTGAGRYSIDAKLRRRI